MLDLTPRFAVKCFLVALFPLFWTAPNASANHCPREFGSRCCWQTYPDNPPPQGFVYVCEYRDGCHHTCGLARAVAIPNVVGMNRSAAESAILAAGLCYRVLLTFDASGNGTAAVQRPTTGQTVAERSTVVVEFPSVVGGGIPPLDGCPP